MDKIQEIVTLYFDAWNTSFQTANSDAIRSFMSKEFVGYWGHSSIKEPSPYYYDYDLDSVLKQMGPAKKSFEVLIITSRQDHNEQIVMGRESCQMQHGYFHAQCMFIWRKEVDGWKLVREYIELER